MTNPNSSQQTNNQQKGDGGNSGQKPVQKKQNPNRGGHKPNKQQPQKQQSGIKNKQQNPPDQQKKRASQHPPKIDKQTEPQNPFANPPQKQENKPAPQKQNFQPQNKPNQQTPTKKEDVQKPVNPFNKNSQPAKKTEKHSQKEKTPKQNPFATPPKKEDQQSAKPEPAKPIKNDKPQIKPEKNISSDANAQTQNKKETPDKELVTKKNPFETPVKEETQIAVKPENTPPKEESNEKLADDDEDILINDGDSIWIIQRIFFSILKTSSVIIIIIVVVWLIWDPDKNPLKKFSSNTPTTTTKVPTKKPPVKTNKPTTTPKETTKNNIQEIDNPISGAITLNLYLENKRLSESEKLIEQSLSWCREGAAIFDLKMTEYFANKSRDQRVDMLKNVLTQIDNLRKEATSLKRSLTLEIEIFSKKMETSDEDVKKYRDMFLNSVQTYDPVGVNNILFQKIEAEQDYFKYKNNIRANEIVMEKIEKIDKYLMQYREIIIANKKAIEEDVQVVDFPADPFNQILTPEEWRNFQEQEKSSNQK